MGLFPGNQQSPQVHEGRPGVTQNPSTGSDYPSLYGNPEGATFNSNASTLAEGIENPFHFSTAAGVGNLNSPGENSYHDSTGSRPQSNHPTPSTSSLHNSSSHTSYTSPPNQSISGSSANSSNVNSNASAQARQDPPLGYIYPGSASWQASLSMASNGNAGRQQQQMPADNIMQPIMHMNSTGMTPGATTGMTPMGDLWPQDGLADNTDWMFGWPGQTPQPQ